MQRLEWNRMTKWLTNRDRTMSIDEKPVLGLQTIQDACKIGKNLEEIKNQTDNLLTNK